MRCKESDTGSAGENENPSADLTNQLMIQYSGYEPNFRNFFDKFDCLYQLNPDLILFLSNPATFDLRVPCRQVYPSGFATSYSIPLPSPIPPQSPLFKGGLRGTPEDTVLFLTGRLEDR
jgi:hypothetical protein